MQVGNTKRILYLAGVLFATTASTPMLGMQRVTLRNGFSYDCARTQTVDNDHLRLFLYSSKMSSSDQGTNFIDISAQAVQNIETLPDPLPNEDSTAPAASKSSSQDVASLITHAGTQHDIDVDLLASVIKAESGGHAHAVSRTGARGLMQLMPGTAQQLGVQDSFQPDQNIAGGTAYLDQLLTRYHDNLSLALAAYNAGPAAVDRYRGVPPYRETRAYVARVEREFKRRKLLARHLTEITASNKRAPTTQDVVVLESR